MCTAVIIHETFEADRTNYLQVTSASCFMAIIEIRSLRYNYDSMWAWKLVMGRTVIKHEIFEAVQTNCLQVTAILRCHGVGSKLAAPPRPHCSVYSYSFDNFSSQVCG